MTIYNTVSYNGLQFTYFINDCLAQNSIGNSKSWEPHMTGFVEKMKEYFNIKNIIDVGANFGYNSLFFSKTVGSEGQIYSFEPQSQNYELLVQNINNNNITNIHAFNYACSDTETEVEIPVFALPLMSVTNMGDITPNFKQYSNVLGYSNVKSIRIDSMKLPKIDLIKIDVQGWETNVINGLHEILLRDKPTLIVEFEHFQLNKTGKTCSDLAQLIRNYGYYIYFLDFEYPSDHVCVHKDHLTEFNNKFQSHIFSHTDFNEINYNISLGIDKKIVISY
jgi:FkbM family methyltransferase